MTTRWAQPSIFSALLLVTVSLTLSAQAPGQALRVIELIADRDNQFKVPGQKKPVITLKAGETVRLHITAHRGTEWNKDGVVHSFTIVALHDEGWDFMLKEGTQEFTVQVPNEPGEYKAQCTVKCGAGHNQMRMKVIITP